MAGDEPSVVAAQTTRGRVSAEDEQPTTQAVGDGATGDAGLEIVRRQAVFREVNERIEEVIAHFDAGATDELAIVCECADAGCVAPIELTAADYEWVRARPSHFVVTPGHESPDVERVVKMRDGYVVVQTFGAGRAIAERLDPRKRALPGSGDR
jgi:hypothetical protein